jgi:hypothetical protein
MHPSLPQISLGFAKLVADERDPKQELTLLLAEQQVLPPLDLRP